ncbi:MAG: translocation/assembly module TamB domain-containing protein [Deltaproteobacteria bacterium]|nr:translocation/assembly module TamB domain-containing protein [Deltaproteobacteria bacterium]
MTITKLTISDSVGVFLYADKLQLDAKPLSLLDETIEVTLLKAEGLNVSRRPVVSPRKKDDDDKGSFGYSVIAHLEVAESELNSLVFAPSLPSSRQGELSLISDLKWLEGALTFELDGKWLDDDGQGVAAKASLTQGQNGESDALSLDVKVSDGPDGTFSHLLGRPDWPKWTMALTGQGPMDGWRGEARLTLARQSDEFEDSQKRQPSEQNEPPSNQNEQPSEQNEPPSEQNQQPSNQNVQPSEQNQQTQTSRPPSVNQTPNTDSSEIAFLTLGLAGKTGSIRRDLIEDPNFSVDAKLTAGPQAPLPDAITSRLGHGLTADAQMALKGRTIKAGLSLDSPNALLDIPDLEFTWEHERPRALTAKGHLDFDVFNVLPQLASAQNSQNQSSPQSAALTQPTLVDASAADKQFEKDLVAGAGQDSKRQDSESLDSEKQDSERLGSERLAGDFNLRLLAQPDSLAIETFSLESVGFSLKADGLLSKNGERKLQATLDVEKNSPWLKLADKFASSGDPAPIALDLAFTQAPDGDFTLKADAQASDINPFYQRLRGPVRAQIIGFGKTQNFELKLDVDSPALETTTHLFQNFTSALGGKIARDDQNFTFKGELQVGAGETVLEKELDLSTRIDLASRGPGDLELTLKELSFDGDGGETLSLKSKLFSLNISPSRPPVLDGALSLDINDWKVVSNITGINFTGLPGKLEFDFKKGTSSGPEANADVSLASFSVGENFSVEDLTLALSAKNYLSAPFFDLSVSAGEGKIGATSFSSGTIAASGEGQNGEVSVALKEPSGGLLADISGTYDLTKKQAHLATLKLAPPQLPEPLSLKSPTTIHFGDTPSSISFLYGKTADLTISGAVNPLHAKIELRNLDLSILEHFTDQSIPKGKADLTAEYFQDGRGTFDFKTEFSAPATIEGLPRTIVANAQGTLRDARDLSGKITVGSRNTKEVTLSYQLPMTPAGRFFKPNLTAPLKASLNWNGEVLPLWSLLNIADRNLTGKLDLKLLIEGTLNEPKPQLDLYLAGATYQDLITGLLISDINLEAHNDKDAITILAEGSDQQSGHVAVSGAVTPFGDPPGISLRAQVMRLAPLHRDDFSMILSALATIEGPFKELKMTVNAVIEEAEINLDYAKGRSSVKTLPIEKPQAASGGPSLDLSIDLPRQIFIRGKGLDSEWGGQMHIGGTASSPIMSGSIKPLRGTFELLSKLFTFTGGEIKFQEGPKLNPLLNIELTRQTSDITAIVRVSGTLSNPKLSWESQPPFPSDEVLSRVLFGKSVSQLSRVEALQLANSLRVMAGLGGPIVLTVINNLRDTLHLSVLRVSDAGSQNDSNRILDSNSFRDNLGLDDGADKTQDSPTIEAGRYLSDNVYVGVEQNLSDNSTGVRVEVELSPSLTLQSLTSSDSSRVGLGWKKDY